MATRQSQTPPREPHRSARSSSARDSSGSDDAFFGHLVANMRKGVLPTRRKGEIVFLNAEARRIFGVSGDEDVVGRSYTQVLRHHPDIVRVVAGAFELSALPNRAELR